MFFLSSCKMFVFSAEGQTTGKAADKPRQNLKGHARHLLQKKSVSRARVLKLCQAKGPCTGEKHPKIECIRIPCNWNCKSGGKGKPSDGREWSCLHKCLVHNPCNNTLMVSANILVRSVLSDLYCISRNVIFLLSFYERLAEMRKGEKKKDKPR